LQNTLGLLSDGGDDDDDSDGALMRKLSWWYSKHWFVTDCSHPVTDICSLHTRAMYACHLVVFTAGRICSIAVC